MKYPRLNALFGAAMYWFINHKPLTMEEKEKMSAAEDKLEALETKHDTLQARTDEQDRKIKLLTEKLAAQTKRILELNTDCSNLRKARDAKRPSLTSADREYQEYIQRTSPRRQ